MKIEIFGTTEEISEFIRNFALIEEDENIERRIDGTVFREIRKQPRHENKK